MTDQPTDRPVMAAPRRTVDLIGVNELLGSLRNTDLGRLPAPAREQVTDLIGAAWAMCDELATLQDTADNTVAALQDRLDVRCRRGGWEWSIKADTAIECAWAATLRITVDPNHHGRADQSTTFYKAGGATPDEVLTEVLTTGVLWAAAQPPGPANPMRPCEWTHPHSGHGYTLTAPDQLAGDWRCAGRDERGGIPFGMVSAPLGQRIVDPTGDREYVTVVDVTWPDSDGLVTYLTVEDGEHPKQLADDWPVHAYDDALTWDHGRTVLEEARAAWRALSTPPAGLGREAR